MGVTFLKLIIYIGNGVGDYSPQVKKKNLATPLLMLRNAVQDHGLR
jgi:hypothetical protein